MQPSSAAKPAALQNYILIENAANKEINRLSSAFGLFQRGKTKAEKIEEALDRLFLAVVHHNPGAERLHERFMVGSEINPQEAKKADLKTIASMLKVRIREWEDEEPPRRVQGQDFNGQKAGFKHRLTLEEALNVANNNFFNLIDGSLGPLWGKATALENVKTELGVK